MKIVKADAKGRVTGLEAAVDYRMEHKVGGRVVLTPQRLDQQRAPVVGVTNVYEWLSVMGLDPNQVLADDIQIGQLSAEQMETAKQQKDTGDSSGTGAFVKVWDLDEEGNPIRVKAGLEVEPRLVCIALDRAKPE